MRNLVLRFVNFMTDQRGATAIEYALIAAGISIVIVVAVNSIGTSLNSTFSSISSQLGGGSS
jgi:pilus assembly protein Flp/PilA